MGCNERLRMYEEKAQLLLDTFSSAYNFTSAHKHSNNKFVNSKVNQFKSYMLLNSENVSVISLKSPGLDDVPNVLIESLPSNSIKLVLIFLNAV